MKEFTIRYKWIIIIGIILVLLLPIVLNYILLIPINAPILGESNGWLAFWGCYIGAIISSTIAFVILFIQRKDNHQENKNNRQLQLNILAYQQQSQWLNNLREEMINNVIVYQADNLREIINFIKTNDLSLIQQKIKETFDNLTYTDTKVAMMMPETASQNDNLLGYNKTRMEIYKKFSAVVCDLQILSIAYCSQLPSKGFDDSLMADASENLKAIFAALKPDEKLTYEQVFNISNKLILPIPALFDDMRESTSTCIRNEQKRIDSTLKENI